VNNISIRPVITGPANSTECPMPNISKASGSSRHSARLVAQTLVSVCAIALCAGLAQAATGDDDHNAVMETVWQGVNLALVLGIIVYFGRGPISDYFASRRDGIKTELSEAAGLLKQAEQRNAELQRRLVDLSSEVEDIRENAGRRAEEEAERILAEASAAAERIRNDAKAAVDQELRRAKDALHDEAANLALEIAARKLTENVGDGDRDRLMDEFITRVEPSSGNTGGSGAAGTPPINNGQGVN